MMDELRFTILGCGSSGGVPRLGGLWGACDPSNPRNARTRCSLLIQRISEAGETNILIDTSPDMRAQLLAAGVGHLDAVIYTHEHADHLHGLDDLRMIVINTRKIVEVYASKHPRAAILRRFSYAFETPVDSPYPPILNMNDLGKSLQIDGGGGRIDLTTFIVEHGNIGVDAIRVNDVVYTPDISEIPNFVRDQLADIDCWILDSLRYTPHPSHANVEQALAWIKEFAPRRAILTNLHIDLDYKTLLDETPSNVSVAHDGLTLSYTI